MHSIPMVHTKRSYYLSTLNFTFMNSYLSLVRYALAVTLCSTLLLSCEEPEEAAVAPVQPGKLSEAVKSQFSDLGFNANDIVKEGENYIVGEDIVVTPQAFSDMLSSEPTIVNNPQGEQYRTFNLVSRSLRTIRVRATDNQTRFLRAIDRAINNFNALNLTFTMVRVASNESADITVRLSSGNSFLGRAEFPSGGRPGREVILDVSAFNGRSDDLAEETTTHELGHCVGLRHSDYYDRSLSCGGQAVDEGSGGVGAVGIPGTVRFDRASLMNSCGSISQSNGEFSFYDQVALRELY